MVVDIQEEIPFVDAKSFYYVELNKGIGRGLVVRMPDL